MKRRHLATLLAVSLLPGALVSGASGAEAPSVERACGLRLPSGRLPGVPAFVVPEGGIARARLLASNSLRCTLHRRDGTRYAVAFADARRRVLEMRFFRTTGRLLLAADAAHAATTASQAQRVSCDSAGQASISDAYWRTTRKWWIGTTTKGLSADKVVKAVRDAQSQFTNNINWCGFADNANPPAQYQGRTSKKVGKDGQSTVDWGTLNAQACPGAVACAVTWYDSKGNPVESDIRFNTANKWVIGSGNGYDIQSAAAHELGHVHQFGHVSNSSRNDETTVMWPYLYTGDTSGRKLGKGDAQANNKHY